MVTSKQNSTHWKSPKTDPNTIQQSIKHKETVLFCVPMLLLLCVDVDGYMHVRRFIPDHACAPQKKCTT